MEARELRIGSLLRKPDWIEQAKFHNEDIIEGERVLNETDLYGEIWGIDLKGDNIEFSWDIPYMCNVIDYYSIDKLEPIPLTEEWLKKLGFKEGHEADLELKPLKWFRRDTIFAYKGDEPCHLFVSDYGDDSHYDLPIRHVKYVHQLQTLYFSLTGEELPLK